jgi:hypothetical protein
MADEGRHSQLAAELAELHKEQLDANSSATFIGWTEEEKAAYDGRGDRIALLNSQLAAVDNA